MVRDEETPSCIATRKPSRRHRRQSRCNAPPEVWGHRAGRKPTIVPNPFWWWHSSRRGGGDIVESYHLGTTSFIDKPVNFEAVEWTVVN
jgi:hypothetical protein